MIKNRLMQLFKDNQGTGAGIRSEVNGDEATMYLYDAIGDWYGVSAKDFISELNGTTAGTVHLRINSPGGDVFDARTMATAIQQSGKKVVAHIDGLCASAATYIATSCSEVEMAEGSFFMIHQAWTLAMGNSEEMSATADLLSKIDASIINSYAKKTKEKCSAEEIQQMMADETWMSAEEALDKGFVDRIFEGETASNLWNISAYDKAPDSYVRNFLAKTKDPVADEEIPLYNRERFERRFALIEALR